MLKILPKFYPVSSFCEQLSIFRIDECEPFNRFLEMFMIMRNSVQIQIVFSFLYLLSLFASEVLWSIKSTNF